MESFIDMEWVLLLQSKHNDNFFTISNEENDSLLLLISIIWLETPSEMVLSID